MAYLHIYTGNGKGKTTAAFGAALRMACSGGNVFIGQFVKGMLYNEAHCGDYLPGITVEQWGRSCILEGKPTAEDYSLAESGLKKAEALLKSGQWQLVILDELTIALHLKLISLEDVITVLQQRHVDTEVIVTGRYAPNELIEIADLVTEMQEIKHYYAQGVLSRSGIDC